MAIYQAQDIERQNIEIVRYERRKILMLENSYRICKISIVNIEGQVIEGINIEVAKYIEKNIKMATIERKISE